MAGGGSGKSGGSSGLSDPSSAVNTGGQSAWAQYRAGEQAGYAPTQDPFSYTGWEQTTPSSFASSGSAGSTQAVPVAQTEKTWADMLEGAAKGAKQWSMGGGGLGGGGGVGSLSVPGFSMGTVRMGPLGFPLTPGQSKILERLGMPPGQAQSFIANQILSGNPAYGPYTAQQIAAARTLSASPGRSTPVAAAEEAD